MTVTLHTFVGLYDRVLVTAGHLLDKVAEAAVTDRVAEGEVLDWRLIGDMNPLVSS